MFLNRKLIVQLSTSRFRPQPKEHKYFSFSIIETINDDESISIPQQQTQYNYDIISSDNIFSSPTTLSQDLKYSMDSSLKLKKNIKTGNFN